MKKINIRGKLLTLSLILVVLALAVVVNLIAMEGTEKFSLKIDLTENKLYDLSLTTREVAAEINDPVVFTVFAREGDYPVMVKEILGRYNDLNSNIIVEYKDPYENPVLVDSLRQKGYSIAENDIIINGRSNMKLIKIDDLYTFNAAKTKIVSLKAEQALTSALLYVSSDEELKAEFTDGHGERPSRALMSIFAENNFEVVRVALGVMGIAGDTDILVIAAPERDFQEDEIAKLESYLERGGKLLVFVEPAEKRLVNFEDFLKRWGIELLDGVVFEEKAYLSNNPVNIVPMYAPHPVNTYFGDKRFFLISPATRVLGKSGWSEYELDLMPVLTSSPDSYAKSGKNFESAVREEGDTGGPFILALSSEREVSDRGESADARLVAIGSRSFYSDDILGKSSYANSEFLVQVINWLIERESSINIPAKNIAPDPINVLPDTLWTIGVIFIGVVPLLIIVAGVVVCMRRRRL